MSADSGCGHHNVLLCVSLIGLVLHLDSVAELNCALRVSELGGGTENHGGVVLLAELVAELHELLSLGAVGGLDHGHVCRATDHSGVLLVLGAGESGVVCYDEYRSTAHTGVGEGVEGVSRYVETDVLHTRHRTYARDGCADSDLCRYLLVGSPLGVDLLVFCKILADLGAGCTGICTGELNSRLVGAASDRLVSEHNYLVTHLLFLKSFTRFALPSKR